ncbi:uncharacterized protein LOC111301687 isoform X1 [Durio zibethinus]|uniref:Uncharacterized protein LOC111301687 isoform X1 n=1 Tax=Durio zibethinus TaxID=66656 RepID=A0A6P5ZK58_DURZI|nr:uncharacterized protein LOC111301687 isoform X1 [Durio zibethinus]XP_022753278.1 uncharacterized protein LOC111301687 isoform X1 [Durio zibethinus]XP_022753287.1 uncharacterized protein LOC111301687 isoform X1 [Durio zibethinus]XP_022753296.1 uncharacterized protein LOC111301687 isoform X1 [Durio zibethinus]
MDYSKEQLLARLKDKKQRYYIVSALADIKVDLKDVNESFVWLQSCAVLSWRLGLGNGGLRMAPEEALSEILQLLMPTVLTSFLYQLGEIHLTFIWRLTLLWGKISPPI